MLNVKTAIYIHGITIPYGVFSFYCKLKSEWIFMKNFANYNFLRSILSKQKPDVLHRKVVNPLTNTQ